MMFRLLKNIKFGYRNESVEEPSFYKGFFNHRRIWSMAVALLTAVALIPLIFITLLDYNSTQNAIVSENKLRTARTTSNVRRTVAYFLDERRSALDFVIRTIPASALLDQARLAQTLQGLKRSFGGFIDLGFIDATGRQLAYVGPYQLHGKDYKNQHWFSETLEYGSYVSEVFLGYRDVPHFVVAVCLSRDNGDNYVLRATIDTERFMAMLSGLDLSSDGDVFIINHQGVLQVRSRSHGDILNKIDVPTPKYSDKTSILDIKDGSGEHLVVGYAYIEDTPFILMVVKKAKIIKPLNMAFQSRLYIFGLSVAVILLVIVGVATSLVSRIRIADRTRIEALRQVEHQNRMASIGRLAAGVAHEINNPLAIINEKAGLIKDLFFFHEKYSGDTKLFELVDSIVNSVERCGTITKRLLGFARQVDIKMEPLRIKEVLDDVLGFMGKDIECRSIEVTVSTQGDLPVIISDRGKLQQIFLNLINNAVQAMDDDGELNVNIRLIEDNMVQVSFTDNGCGIAQKNLNRIFEPFFSTKKKQGGTGLGLSIIYGLVKELDGSMNVESQEGNGTTFTVQLPLKPNLKKERGNESASC